ncbi:alpha/beta hydrolase [Ferrimonas senticii]|uniref:alpha/beta hydrolase n=1 Tax=Ferrimonas senticii TaxID=394566 RepID=UPI0004113927|nr:alpha/beta hydrolase [Ferrimonas senticii]
MRWLMLIALWSLAGCSPFYAPDQEIRMLAKDYSHQVTDYYLRSSSGNSLHLQYHRSSQPEPSLLIHFHGNAGNLSKTAEKSVWLVEHGYDVLLFDYSGYGQSQGRASREALRQDGISVLNHVVNWTDVRHSQRYLLGTSMGGAVVVDALASSGLQQQFDLLVVDSSFDQYSLLAGDVVSRYPFGRWLSSMARTFVSDQHSPKDQIAQLDDIPLLIAHCQSDGLIPSQRGFELFSAATGDKAFWLLPQCRHARTFTAEFPEHQRLLLAQLQQFKPDSGQAAIGLMTAQQLISQSQSTPLVTLTMEAPTSTVTDQDPEAEFQ